VAGRLPHEPAFARYLFQQVDFFRNGTSKVVETGKRQDRISADAVGHCQLDFLHSAVITFMDADDACRVAMTSYLPKKVRSSKCLRQFGSDKIGEFCFDELVDGGCVHGMQNK
jgi:hypothetical protein